jgi:two-component system response regulator FixJ
MNTPSVVYVVDDDAGIRNLLLALTKSRDVACEVFESGDDFLRYLEGRETPAGCAIVDVKLPGLSGIELLQRLNKRGIQLPVIIITGYADVPLAVEAMRAGAVTFLEKPFEDQDLWTHIQAALEQGEQLRQDQARKSIIETRFTELTSDEVAVMLKMLRGLPNKRIAAELDIGLRTVELRRANVLKKMQVDSLAELVRLAMIADKMPEFDEP